MWRELHQDPTWWCQGNTLPHRTFFTTKLIPKLDKLIDDKNMVKMREMTEEQAPGAASATVMKLQYEEFRIACKTGRHNLHSDMNDREPGVFHKKCMKIDIHVWIKTFLNE